MQSRKIISTVAGVLVVGGVLAFTGITLLGNKAKVEEQVYRKPAELKPLVSTHVARIESINANQEYLGTFKPNREIDLLSETNGKVIYVGVQQGVQVAKGQIIARLDSDLLQAQLIAARANYEKSLGDVKRYEDAVAQEAMPGINLENARLGLKTAESQLKALEKQLTLTEITAPFSGIVAMKMFDLGSVLAPGTPLIKLIDISTLKLVVSIPEKEVSNLKIGQSLDIHTELYPDISLQGTIVSIAAKADAAHNFETEIELANRKEAPLRAGMYGSTQLIAKSREALLVPRVALIGSAKDPRVFCVKNDTAKLTTVALGETFGDMVEIRSGLDEGDSVVTVGQINLSDNTAVKVVNGTQDDLLTIQ